MKLTRPLVFLDIESATLNPHQPDPQRDRIIEIAATKYFPAHGLDDPDPLHMHSLVNPGIPINEECAKIHGYTNEKVADLGGFPIVAHQWFNFLDQSDIAGFGVWGYDLPLLCAEFERCGLSLCWRSRMVFDAGMVFKKKEERSLTAAARFYCNCEHDGAHGAIADTAMAVRVFKSQLQRYPDVAALPLPDLHKFCQYDERLTLDGKIAKGPDGDPIYTFGKVKGTKVKDDLGFADWMLYKASFPRDTREWLEAYIQSLQNEDKQEFRHERDPSLL